ncbi:MAG: RagB/SusD family nutrient uptake outer membrane protein [Bacteroidetes bacterium]|nr:RagB/SusD family nutrient uptake outer membrane protein [Bacteroidota bacterium]
MKSIKYILVLIAIFSTSCSDWLEMDPVGEKFESNFYQTEEDIFQGLVATYSMLQPKYYNNWSSYYFLANFPSDDSEVVGGGSGDRPEYHAIADFKMLPTNTAILELWRRGFYGVNRANAVILNANPEASAKSKEYIAEAKFLRAYFYFELVRFFGDVPLITKQLLPGEYDQPRVDAAIVYQQIITDLQEAITDLADAPSENYRASKGAGYSLLGKVYLYMASPYYQQRYNFELGATDYYQLAMQQFQEVYGQYALEPNYDDIWSYEHEHGVESIFEIEYANIARGGDWGNGRVNGGNIDVQMSGPRGISTDTLNAGWGFDMVSTDLIALYDAEGDVVRKDGTAYGEAFLTSIGASSWEKNDGYTGWFSKKRAPWAHLTFNSSAEWNYETNERVIRYGDVLLMMAEAALGGGTGNPDTYFNEVRQRAGLGTISGVTLADIKKERRLELAMEGFRYFDLVRWGDAPSVLSDRGFKEGTHEVFPIPQDEIINSNYTLTQNDGY